MSDFEFRPFQKHIIRDFENYNILSEYKDSTVDPYYINIVLDTNKNPTGKSFLIDFCNYKELAAYLPPIGDCKSMMLAAFYKKKSSGYITELPKNMNDETMSYVFSILEILKGGIA